MRPDITREARNAAVLAGETRHAKLGRRTLQGSFVTAGGQAGRMVIQLGSTAVLARLLAPEDFGLIAMCATVTAFLGLFTNLGLSAATVQKDKLNQPLVSALFYTNLLVGLGLMALTMAAAPLVALLFDEPRVTSILAVYALSIPFTAAGAQHSALLNRGMRWGAIQFANLAGLLAGAVAAIASAVLLDAEYWALVVQAVATAAITTGLLWLASDWRPSLPGRLSVARNEIRFGLGLTGFNFVNYFHRQADNVLIGWWWGAGPLGLYSRAYNIFLTIQNFAAQPVSMVLMPLLSRARDDPAYWRRNVLDAGSVVALSNGLVAVLLVCLAPSVVAVMLGRQWDAAVPVLQALAPALLLSSSPVMGAVFMARGDSKGFFASGVVTSAIFLTCFAIALPHGIVAMGAAYSAASVVAVPTMIYMALRRDVVSMGDYLRRMTPFLAVGVLVIVGYVGPGGQGRAPLSLLEFVLHAAALSTVYGGACLAILAWDPEQAQLKARLLGVWRSAAARLKPLRREG